MLCRFDVLCCLSGSKAEGAAGAGEGALYKLFQHAYVPFLMRREVRATVMIVFFAWLCSSVAVSTTSALYTSVSLCVLALSTTSALYTLCLFVCSLLSQKRLNRF